MIEGADYFVHLVDFPTCASGGAVLANEDGTYTVLLNARLSDAQNKSSMQHEYGHMERGDLYSPLPVQEIERGAT